MRNTPADQRQTKTLARELVRQGKLTPYQAEIASCGTTDGLKLGDYLLLEKLGAGGMGEVYIGLHRRMKRRVAIKLLPAHSSPSPEAVARFHREVEAAARLNHPHIVTAYDAGEWRGRQYLVMEYVSGCDLAALVRADGALSASQAVDYTLQAARALRYAHGEGVIHRDVKPANLLLDTKGIVKLLDLGLARFEGGGNLSGNSGELTRSGQLMGSLAFMPPEQAADVRLVDHRGDIYSLGCTLYYLLTARPPYAGVTAINLIVAHREHPIPSITELRPDVSPELDAIFARMVAKDADDRYDSMSEVIAALEAAPVGSPLAAGPYDETQDAAAGHAHAPPPLDAPLAIPIGLPPSIETANRQSASNSTIRDAAGSAAWPTSTSMPTYRATVVRRRRRGWKDKPIVWGVAAAALLLIGVIVLASFHGSAKPTEQTDDPTRFRLDKSTKNTSQPSWQDRFSGGGFGAGSQNTANANTTPPASGSQPGLDQDAAAREKARQNLEQAAREYQRQFSKSRVGGNNFRGGGFGGGTGGGGGLPAGARGNGAQPKGRGGGGGFGGGGVF